ncbi:HEAT repeat domain-containing protein [Fulvivirga lutimaris]|uniref:HEAT repeat domain-containing protein n=1 Tax=Fulvivirga lutimaris TaxID=1819566 RepID=UPI0012BC6A59|nr:HEAT repeat domain-containing protein [Fulvivirga lutimaris]MTI38656.1 HEAT repeat domain-containing protein [Fulvivirga lutimaris]
MEESKMTELINDYIDGYLSGELKVYVEKHIEEDKEWKATYEKYAELNELMNNDKELEAPASLRKDFQQFLDHEIENQTKVVPMNVGLNNKRRYQIAAAVAILAVGYILGISMNKGNTDEIDQLRNEMAATKALVLNSLDDQSASSRLGAVNASYSMEAMDDDIVQAFVKTLNTDENINVRLAALEALSRYADKENVRKALIESLSTQDKPAVQIVLINLLVQLKEKRAIEPLKKLTEDEENMEAVRDEANYGIFKLS